MANVRNTSPSINFTETDNTFRTENFGLTALAVAGEFKRGRAFEPIEIADYTTHKEIFGDTDPCYFEGTSQLKYEGSYIAKQFLKESNELFVCRILGLSGYDAGDAWGIKVGANLDTSTVIDTGNFSFTAKVRLNQGVINKVEFSDSALQDLYDAGLIASNSLPNSSSTTGDTLTLSNTLIGNCDTFTGARYVMDVTSFDETYICLTGLTTVNQDVMVSQEVQNCEVLYSGGTVTTNSKFQITVSSAVVLQNVDTSAIILIEDGVITIIGGTITHNTDGSISFVGCTIYLPNGTIITGTNEYKICDLGDNVAVYDCDQIEGSGYTIVTGTTVIQELQTSGTTQLVETQIGSGIIDVELSGTGVYVSGEPYAQYDNLLISLLRSYATYDADENLQFNVFGNVLSIESKDGGVIRPLDDFIIKGVDRNGVSFEYDVSLDRSKANYIFKVFTSFQQCCPSDKLLYIEELFDSTLEFLINNDLVYCIKPEICYNAALNNYKQQFEGAKTPWVVSELMGNTVSRLFRFHTFTDGDAGNDLIKVSIENINPDRGTFDVSVRSFADTDRRPVVLERYSRLTLNESDTRYIAKVIGTSNGEYVLKSSYIMVEMASSCLAENFPAGFEGYPVRDYECAQSPQMFYKTSYEDFERPRNVYLGISEKFGFDRDFFTYKGTQFDGTPWTGHTAGFHMDKDAANASVVGVGSYTFEVGEFGFKNNAELSGTKYEKVNARKFTMAPYGGFDGWDIHRKRRTNLDTYAANGIQGQKGFASGVFDAYSDRNIDDGLPVINSDYYAYLKGIRAFNNRDEYRISLITFPNVNTTENSNLVESTIDMIEEERCDVFYFPTTLDTDESGQPLLALDAAGAIDGLFDTSYAGTYFPFGQIVDEANNRNVWIPATCEAVRVAALTDKISAPWYAIAGSNRAETEFIQARLKLSETERDTLYTNRVNPLFTQRKADKTSPVFLWGNRTLQIDESDLSSINVRRMLLYVQRLVRDEALVLLFEPNDDELRTQIQGKINNILADVRTRRGLSDFKVQFQPVSDDDPKAVNGQVQIKATKAAEFININFALTQQGVDFV